MFPDDRFFDPFSSHNILEIPDLDLNLLPPWLQVAEVDNLKSESLALGEIRRQDLPSLRADTFKLDVEDVPLPDLESSATSFTVSEAESSLRDEKTASPVFDFAEDVWALEEVIHRKKDNQLVSWDRFLDKSHTEPPPAYITELPAEDFNAVWQFPSAGRHKPLLKLARPDVFVASLQELGMGRESAFFQLDGENRWICHNMGEFSLPGLTSETIQYIMEDFKLLGTEWRKLRQLVCSNPGLDSPRPILIAFFSCIRSVLSALESWSDETRYEIQSILQLLEQNTQPKALVEILCFLLPHVGQASLCVDELLTKLYVQTIRSPSNSVVLEEVCRRMMAPLLNEIECATGLNSLQETSVKLSNENVPSEVLPLTLAILECRNLLKSYEPDNPLIRGPPTAWSSEPPKLEIVFSWDEIVQLQARAAEYEEDSKSTLLQRKSPAHTFRAASSPKESLEERGDPFVARFELSRPLDLDTTGSIRLSHGHPRTNDSLFDAVLHSCEAMSDDPQHKVPPNQAVSLCLSPLLAAQHRLFSYSVLQTLLERHQLRQHLLVLQRYHLFGDGLFTARLSQALFDPDQASSEGTRRTGAVTGLRLENRDTWPPASSELRLALMGILAESMVTQFGKGNFEGSDSISFAIRDLPEDELDKCRDVDSNSALDFLRLQYKPPGPILEAVITPEVLKKYDRMFKHLLRLLRVQSIARALLREASNRHETVKTSRVDQRFRIDVQHFVTSLADYTVNVAIAVPWDKFERTIRNIERCLARNDYDGTLSLVGGLDSLRRLHEDTLDEMMRAMFLKKKQSEAMRLLEDLFEIILQFAATVRQARKGDSGEISGMHEEFRKRIAKLIGSLQSLGSETEGLSLHEHLLVRLDIFGYWNRERERAKAT